MAPRAFGGVDVLAGGCILGSGAKPRSGGCPWWGSGAPGAAPVHAEHVAGA
jgi:hypothetical protein